MTTVQTCFCSYCVIKFGHNITLYFSSLHILGDVNVACILGELVFTIEKLHCMKKTSTSPTRYQTPISIAVSPFKTHKK